MKKVKFDGNFWRARWF